MGCTHSVPKNKSNVPIENPYSKIHRQVRKEEIESNKMLKMSDVVVPNNLLVSADDFEIGSYLQEGGMGKVYSAQRKSDGHRVALKFFGYTARLATPEDVQHEIDLMAALKGVEGFIQTEGIFWDSVEGVVPGAKLHRVACPVIVMELMEGGELFDRMHALKEVSEKYIARIFKSVIIALDSMHRKGFVHRDFKLENAMMVSMEKDSPVRIIDFGMVCKISNYTASYRGSAIQGTPGYIAPESILYHTYSAKTDLWQAGCTLYSLLSGLLPFNRDDMEQVTHFKYYPMKGVGWDSISDEAKDLVRKILTRRPESRIDAEGILKHPWIVSEAPDVNMGDDYFARIKQLALRQKLKCFFLDSRLAERSKLQRSQLTRLLPFLAQSNSHSHLQAPSKRPSSVRMASRTPPAEDLITIEYVNSNPGSTDSQEDESDDMQSRLKHLKDIIIPSLAAAYSSDDPHCLDFTKDMCPEDRVLSMRITAPDHHSLSLSHSLSDSSDNKSTSAGSAGVAVAPPPSPGGQSASSTGGSHRINYLTFKGMMEDCDLPELASFSVFKIFDLNKCGYIDLKDFLLTMIAFRQEPVPEFPEDEEAQCTPDTSYHGSMRGSLHGSLGSSLHMSKHGSGAGAGAGTFSPSSRRGLRRRDSIKATDEAVRLYFNVFDYKETGFIDKEEMRTVVACILQDQAESDLENNMGSMSFNVEDLFDIIDVKKNGRIDYEEFKQFYQAVLTNTTTRRSIIMNENDED